MIHTDKTLTLDIRAYTWAVDKFNLGEPVPTLRGGTVWVPKADRPAVDAWAREELGDLLDRSGNLSDFGEDVFAVLQRPDVEYTTLAQINGHRVNVRAAAYGTDALLIISAHDFVEIDGIRRDELATQVVRTLPQTPAAHIHSLTAERDLLVALDKGADLRVGQNVFDAKQMAKLFAMDRDAAGEMTVKVRDSPYDPKQRSIPGHPPVWMDTEIGRILITVDSRGWTTVKGCSAADMARTFAELEQSARRGRR